MKFSFENIKIIPLTYIAFVLCTTGLPLYLGGYSFFMKTNPLTKQKIGKHGLSDHPLYGVWSSLKRRCLDINAPGFKNYGGSGVMVCQEWLNSFQSFYDWAISNGWESGMEIDKDILYKKKYGTKKGLLYSAEFCCIVTHKKNSNNRTNNRYFTINKIKYSLSELADKYHIHYKALFARLQLGWDIKKALETPLRNFRRKIYVEDLEGNYIGTYNGCRKVMNELGVGETTVSECCNGVRNRNHSKYKFRYA